MHYISLIAMQSRSAVALEQVLADYFEVPVEIEQFTGAWYPLGRLDAVRDGRKESMSTQMGFGAVVGDAVWDRQGRVRIRIGPLTMKRYNEFLPEGSAYGALRAMTRFFSNNCVDFEVQLVLDRTQVPSFRTRFECKAAGASGLGVMGKDCAVGRRSGRYDSGYCEGDNMGIESEMHSSAS